MLVHGGPGRARRRDRGGDEAMTPPLTERANVYRPVRVGEGSWIGSGRHFNRSTIVSTEW